MKLYRHIFMGTLLALFSTAFSEVTVEIISPSPGERIEPCQSVIFVADVQTTGGEEINSVYFYNRFKSNNSFGYARTAPWETEMDQIKTGNYSITAVARLADNTQIESKPLIFTVGDSTKPKELLYNGSFYDCDSTIEPWYLDLWNAEGTVSLVTDTLYGLGDCIRIDPTKPGNQPQYVSISQYANVKKGNTYKLSFSAYAPEKKRILFGILAKSGGSEHVLYVANTEIEGELLCSKEFTITEDLQSGYFGLLRIGVGDNTNPIYFKWVSLKDITPPPPTEVNVKVFSSDNSEINQGDVIRPCQDITLVADIQTTEPGPVEKVRFYNNNKLIKFDTYFPWEYTIEKIKSGVYNVTTVAYLKDGRKITSEVLKFVVVRDSIAAGEQLYNRQFDCQTFEPWEQWHWTTGGASTIHFLNDDAHFGGGNYIMIEIEEVGSSVWSCMLAQRINFILGHTYKISALLDVDERKLVGVETGTGYTGGIQFQKTFYVDGQTEYTAEFTVTKDVSGQVHQDQYLWIGAGSSEHSLYIKQVSLIDTAAPDSMFYLIDPGTDIEYRAPNAVENYKLFQAYPNPFNPTTTIKYNLQWPGNVKLTVYNALGKEVVELVNDFQVEGSHSVLFDAQHLPTGIYLYQLQIDGEYSEMKKMVFLK